MNKEIQQLLDLVQKRHYRNLIFDLDRTITRLDLPWEEWIESVTAALPAEASKKLSAMLEVEGSPWGEVINEQITKDHEFYEKYIAICQQFEVKQFAHTPYADLVKIIPKLKEQGSDILMDKQYTRNGRTSTNRNGDSALFYSACNS